ncbi:hypothetical protein GCM10009087_41970 [Sphingomonas oligophenolica]|uniref:Uncharacterized protein n=1 Tax=Sphingomonas oligophenolica TaxID=301154 RepID=A0ABU9YCF3_9SPHN
MRVLTPLIAVALTSSAVAADSAMQRQTDEQKLAAALSGLVPDKPTDCVDQYRTSQAQIQAYGGTILYKVSKSLIYRNDTGGGCENIARGDIFVTHSNAGRLCKGDIGRTISPGMHGPTGSCALGSFVAYRKAPK